MAIRFPLLFLLRPNIIRSICIFNFCIWKIQKLYYFPTKATSDNNDLVQVTIKVLATPLRDMQQTTFDLPQDEKDKKKKKKKKSNRENFEKLEALSQRIRHCILKRVAHRRHCSS